MRKGVGYQRHERDLRFIIGLDQSVVSRSKNKERHRGALSLTFSPLTILPTAPFKKKSYARRNQKKSHHGVPSLNERPLYNRSRFGLVVFARLSSPFPVPKL